MKILAINSSPRTGRGSKTEMMLTPLIEGMRDEGADVEVINLCEKSVKPCIGCFTCWTKTPGQCMHKDDMAKELFPKWLAADIVVYASPLYYHTMNAVLKTFIERTLPAAQPFFEKNAAGKIYHPLRNKVPAAVTLTVCGFPDMSEFDAMLTFQHSVRHEEGTYIADIVRPAAEQMTFDFLKPIVDDILDATRQAGREIVRNQKISDGTLARIQQQLMDSDLFRQLGNLYWDTCISEGVTPKEFIEKKMVPRPDCVDSFMTLFPFGLNAAAVGDRKIFLQFDFSGRQPEQCHFCIEQQRIAAMHGPAQQPDIIIKTPFELWMDIITRKADPQQMFLDQKYTVTGDFEMLLQLFLKTS